MLLSAVGAYEDLVPLTPSASFILPSESRAVLGSGDEPQGAGPGPGGDLSAAGRRKVETGRLRAGRVAAGDPGLHERRGAIEAAAAN